MWGVEWSVYLTLLGFLCFLVFFLFACLFVGLFRFCSVFWLPVCFALNVSLFDCLVS